MIWLVYLEGTYAGTVIASTEDDALREAFAKFGNVWGSVKVEARRT